jgi:hypothetical protein
LYYDPEGNRLDIPMMIPKLVATDKWFDIVSPCPGSSAPCSGSPGTTYTYSYSAGTPVDNTLKKSASLNKIMFNNTIIMSIYTGMYILLDDTDIFGGPTLKKGSMFSYQINPKGIWEEQEDV